MLSKKRVPAYCLHKASGQARTILGGRHFYLGRYGSAESREAYARLLAEAFRPGAAPHEAESSQRDPPDLTINELLVRYLDFAKRYYVKDGKSTKELTCMKEALGHMRKTFGSLLAVEFGPLKLKAVRQQMIDAGLARGVINNRVNRIKRVIKWAVSEELLPAGAYEAVQAVSGLRFGRSEAKETEPVRPVPDSWVDATVPYLSPQVSAMVQLQRLLVQR
jgi:hypothetical protein